MHRSSASNQSPSYLLIFSSSHLPTFSSSNLLIFSSSNLLTFQSSHLPTFSSSNLHNDRLLRHRSLTSFYFIIFPVLSGPILFIVVSCCCIFIISDISVNPQCSAILSPSNLITSTLLTVCVCPAGIPIKG